MRTNEERSRLIHKRTAEIKREKHSSLSAFSYRYRGMDAGTDDRSCGRKHCPFFGSGKYDRQSCCSWLYCHGPACFSPWCMRNRAALPSAAQK